MLTARLRPSGDQPRPARRAVDGALHPSGQRGWRCAPAAGRRRPGRRATPRRRTRHRPPGAGTPRPAAPARPHMGCSAPPLGADREMAPVRRPRQGGEGPLGRPVGVAGEGGRDVHRVADRAVPRDDLQSYGNDRVGDAIGRRTGFVGRRGRHLVGPGAEDGSAAVTSVRGRAAEVRLLLPVLTEDPDPGAEEVVGVQERSRGGVEVAPRVGIFGRAGRFRPRRRRRALRPPLTLGRDDAAGRRRVGPRRHRGGRGDHVDGAVGVVAGVAEQRDGGHDQHEDGGGSQPPAGVRPRRRRRRVQLTGNRRTVGVGQAEELNVLRQVLIGAVRRGGEPAEQVSFQSVGEGGVGLGPVGVEVVSHGKGSGELVGARPSRERGASSLPSRHGRWRPRPREPGDRPRSAAPGRHGAAGGGQRGGRAPPRLVASPWSSSTLRRSASFLTPSCCRRASSMNLDRATVISHRMSARSWCPRRSSSTRRSQTSWVRSSAIALSPAQRRSR